MRVRFWGTRGSLAKPGRTTLHYGGNTSCVEVRTTDDTLIMFDCGTGAHGFGQALVAEGTQPMHGHLLITHTHWDHIQGFPFFAPLFVPTNVWDIYAPGGMGKRLEEVLAGQMEYAYFPVTLAQLGATIRYHELVEGRFEVGEAQVTARYLNHPGLTLGYRVHAGGVVVVYATDHEPHAKPQLGPARESSGDLYSVPAHREDQGHIAFLRGADLVIHDAQYSAEEYAQKVGWGHSSMEYAVDMALAAGVKRLALFHHDPTHDDETLDRLVERCRRRVTACQGTLTVFAAAEGLTIELPPGIGLAAAPDAGLAPASIAEQRQASVGETTILVVDDEPDIVRLLRDTLAPEGYRLLSADNGEVALHLARHERPSLILLDWRMPGQDGLDVCRSLRNDPDPALRRIPVVLLTAQTGDVNIAAGFSAGATDYLTKPFRPAHVRSRVRGWLLRSRQEPAGGGTAPTEIP